VLDPGWGTLYKMNVNNRVTERTIDSRIARDDPRKSYRALAKMFSPLIGRKSKIFKLESTQHGFAGNFRGHNLIPIAGRGKHAEQV
jgi:hypothetical protein